MKLSEYDYTVQHRPNTKMRHADALSRSVNAVETELTLSRDVIREEQEEDELCTKYKLYENFLMTKMWYYIVRGLKNSLVL